MREPPGPEKPRRSVDLHAFVSFVIGRIIEQPESLRVNIFEGDHAIVIEARVAVTDAGRVIGRQGKTINALRTLAGAIAARGGKRAVLDIVETPRPQPEP